MKTRMLQALAIGLLVTVTLVVTTSEKSSAKAPDLVSTFGKIDSPHGDLYVHVLAQVPDGSRAADVAAAAVYAQGARQISSAEFSLNGLVWSNTMEPPEIRH